MIPQIILTVILAVPMAHAHSWYTGTRDHATGYSCCSGADCQEIDPAKVACGKDGCTLTLEAGDTPTVIKAGKYWYPGSPQQSPDMGMHTCFVPKGIEQGGPPDGYVGVLRCLWWGGGV